MESGDGLAFQKKQIDLRCPITASQVAAELRCALAFDHRMFTCDDEMSGFMRACLAALTGFCLTSQMVRMPKKTDYKIHLQSSQAMVDKEDQL
nr:hypothetical protein Itr_chr10CG03050 [Ipomoea trifida]